MKLFYIISNVFLLLLSGILAYMNVSFKPSPQNPLLLKKISVPPFLETVKKMPLYSQNQSLDFSPFLEDNLFSQYRAKDFPESFIASKPIGIELVGIIKFGDEAGALILDKTTQNMPRSPSQQPPNATESKSVQPEFYRLNSTLPNGFLLKEINPDSVLLVRGKEQLILQLDYEDEGTKSRTATSSSSAPREPTIIQQIQITPVQQTQAKTKQNEATLQENQRPELNPDEKQTNTPTQKQTSQPLTTPETGRPRVIRQP